MSKLVNSLNKSIKAQSLHNSKNANFDKTRNAIIQRQSKSSNKYDITLDGRHYNGVPVYGNATFKKGDTCRVMVPNNQKSQMFILGGGTYDIGDVHININNADPSNSFGGSWQQIGTTTVGDSTLYWWKRIQ